MSIRTNILLKIGDSLTVCSAALAALVAQPLLAQEQGDASNNGAEQSTASYPTLPPDVNTIPGFRPGGGPGLFIISRSVGPRNALAPEVGSANTVRIAPEEGTFAFDNPVVALSDDQVAQVASGLGSVPTVQAMIQQPLELLAGNDNIRAEGASPSVGGGGLGGMVGDAVGAGMSGLASALAGLSGLNQ